MATGRRAPRPGDAGPARRYAGTQPGEEEGRLDLHPRITVNPQAAAATDLAGELQFWADLGVRHVGLSAAKLAAAGVEAGLEAVRRAGLEVGYLVHGVTTPVTDDAGWREERAVLMQAVQACGALGAGCVYFCSGPLGGLRWEQGVEQLGRRLVPVVQAASSAGVALALENSLSVRSEISFLHSVRDALVAAEHVGTGVCVDLYACWAEPALARTLRDHLPLIHLVQCSDFIVGTLVQPNRWVPGDGDLPLASLLDDVLAAGYEGVIDLELLGPAIMAEGPRSAVRRGVRWLNEYLDSRRVPRRAAG